jgi:hypothetical protein
VIIRSLPRVPAFPFAFPWLMRGKVRVKNASGEAIPFGACMRVTTTTIVNNCIVATVAKPDTSFRRSYLVNCGQTINAATDARGWGTRLFEDGLVLCTGTPTVGSEWGPEPSSWTLKQDYPGFLITGGTQTVGGNTCVAAIQVSLAELLVKNASGGDYGAGSGPSTYKIYVGTPGSETDSGMTISAYNKSSIAFKDGKFGAIGWLNGKAYAVPFQT